MPDPQMQRLKDLLYADQSLKDGLTSLMVFAPELKRVLDALDQGRHQEALWQVNAMEAASTSRAGIPLLLAHVRSACGDRAGAVEALEGFLASIEGSSRSTLQTWHRLRDLGVQPPPELADGVLGVIVEIAFPEGPDTVAAYADGSSRFFSRKGGAILGEDPRPFVREAARRVVSRANDFVKVAKRAKRTGAPRPEPEPGTVRFTLLTPAGQRVAVAGKGALRSGKDDLRPLFEPVAELIALKVEGARGLAA
jgi:hypothetical protein